MSAPVHIVDAFADGPFGGNPAAVCLLDEPAAAAWMQRVAAEMNLSETAFVHPVAGGASGEDGDRGDGREFDLRWFTPTREVPLCGHATLASAHVLWDAAVVVAGQAIRFRTLSGRLEARQSGQEVEIHLPAFPVEEARPPARLLDALGAQPVFSGITIDRGGGDRDWLLELASEAEVRDLEPDLGALRELPEAVIVTALADGTRRSAPDGAAEPYDFVSRYFAPSWGVDEDPVTGAAHCSLAPFWSARLGRTELIGYQASARGGRVRARVLGDQVALGGRATTVLRGRLDERAGPPAAAAADRSGGAE